MSALQIGDFVRSSRNELGIGKLRELSRKQALIRRLASCHVGESDASFPQPTACAFVVRLPSLLVALLMVSHQLHQLFQQLRRHPTVQPDCLHHCGYHPMHLRHRPLRVFPPDATPPPASQTDSSPASGTNDASGRCTFAPHNDPFPVPISGPGNTAPPCDASVPDGERTRCASPGNINRRSRGRYPRGR